MVLHGSLDEEKQTDMLLTKLAKAEVNQTLLPPSGALSAAWRACCGASASQYAKE